MLFFFFTEPSSASFLGAACSPFQTGITILCIMYIITSFLCSLLVRDREERLAALTAAQQEAMEELQKKIQLKV